MDKLRLLILFVFFLPQLTRAQADSLLTLRDLITEARVNNPDLQALRADYEIAESRISWFSHVPDPMAAVELSDNMTMYSITQQIPFPTKIGQRREFAQNAADYSNLLYIEKEQSIIRQVKQGYAHLLLLQARIRTIERSVAFLEQIHNMSRQKYALNEAPQAEVLMAQVRLAKAENQWILLKDDLMIAQAKLNTLINRDIETNLSLSDKPAEVIDTIPLPSLYALARQNQPRLKVFHLKQKEAEIKLSLARQTYLPDLAFKYTYEKKIDDMHSNKYMIGLTIPIWFLDKQNKLVREAAANLRGASARYERLENETLLAVKLAKTRVEKHQHVIEVYENSVLPQAEAALKSALIAYEVNKLDFQTLLNSEEMLVESEFDYDEARANLIIAMADLQESIGFGQ
jgi:cobalt-zinc-cadmium efflux system outer membrane protein